MMVEFIISVVIFILGCCCGANLQKDFSQKQSELHAIEQRLQALENK